jgi:subtilisin family serine protease
MKFFTFVIHEYQNIKQEAIMNRRSYLLQVFTVTLVLLMAACSKEPMQDSSSQQKQLTGQAPLLKGLAGVKYIDSTYIVVLKDDGGDVDGEVNKMDRDYRIQSKHRYKSAIRGFSGRFSQRAIDQLRMDPHVAYIEQDQEVHIVTTQTGATWGLDRTDQKALPLDASYTYNQDGTGVDAYIIDCGILLSHADFGGRAVTGYDAVTTGGLAIDGNGHGTHVAGTVGGQMYGMAKGVRLIAVRVLDNTGSGSVSGVIAGINWVTSDHATNKPAVANMSLGGGTSTALDDAVRASIADGITYCIAAGNSGALASTSSPARVTEAITVGATDNTDKFAYFSNYGPIVDICAPGVNITSDWITSTTATNTISGTSMATPHVAGAVALFLQANPTATPDQVQTAIKANGTPNKISALGTGTVNLLLYSVIGTVTPPAIPDPPALNAPANGATGVAIPAALSWIASTGATSYNVQVSTRADLSTPVYNSTGITGTSTTVTGLAANTQYYWRVSATNDGGTSAWSTILSFTTAAASSVPAVPALSSPSNNANRVSIPATLSWKTAANATSYTVQVSTSSKFSSFAYNVSGITATSTSVSSLSQGKTYYWRVSASNSAGATSAWSSVRSFRTR